MSWNDKSIARLAQLVASGMSAGRIAEALSKEFNARFSRSAVIGKVSRMGLQLTGHKKTAVARRATRAKRLVARQHRPRRETPPRSVMMPVEVRPRAQLPQRSMAETVSFEDRQPGQCCWPFTFPGASAMRFCGHERLAGRPYCLPHDEIARKAQ